LCSIKIESLSIAKPSVLHVKSGKNDVTYHVLNLDTGDTRPMIPKPLMSTIQGILDGVNRDLAMP
tara:strand:+ start:292 stop:486 length:195 start_codon:yes stop_codon:yes gene_type:complete